MEYVHLPGRHVEREKNLEILFLCCYFSKMGFTTIVCSPERYCSQEHCDREKQ